MSTSVSVGAVLSFQFENWIMMGFNFSKTAIFFLMSISLFANVEYGVTYEFSGGRFGDCLMSYLHAKWLSYEKNIPLIYQPFIYSSELVLSEKERSISEIDLLSLTRVYWGGRINPRIHLPILYICPYFPESEWELRNSYAAHGRPWISFKVNWKDPIFRQLARAMVAPKKEMGLITPPKDCVRIAIHYRDGGAFDPKDVSTLFPLKFPPLDFYIQSLLSAIEACKGKPIYCFIFTDAIDPHSLVRKFESAVPLESMIQFDYRQQNQTNQVLEDFFSFFNFDILIRSESNFSLIPSLIHDFAIVYYPDSSIRIQKEVNEELYEKIRARELPAL